MLYYIYVMEYLKVIVMFVYSENWHTCQGPMKVQYFEYSVSIVLTKYEYYKMYYLEVFKAAYCFHFDFNVNESCFVRGRLIKKTSIYSLLNIPIA